MESGKHESVMLKEAVDALNVRPGGRYIDGTYGRGGHSREIAARGGEVLGIDRDAEAVAAAREAGDRRCTVVRGRHGDMKEIALAHGWDAVDGVLLDLGVSSPQLDEAERGFSFMRDGPLDMRMDADSAEPTAAEIVNTWSAEALEEIFRTLGEEPQAGKMARAIVRERGPRPFAGTLQLASLAERVAGRRSSRHPATRIFQALRMAVNDETGQLEKALEAAASLLRKPGGRLAVISFESITDRIVKRFVAEHAGRWVSLQQGGRRWEGRLPRMAAAPRRAARPGEEELARNVRARSAKLRVAEMMQEDDCR